MLCVGGMRGQEDLLKEVSTKTMPDEDDGVIGTVARRTFVNQVDNQTFHFNAGRGKILQNGRVVDGQDPAVWIFGWQRVGEPTIAVSRTP